MDFLKVWVNFIDNPEFDLVGLTREGFSDTQDIGVTRAAMNKGKMYVVGQSSTSLPMSTVRRAPWQNDEAMQRKEHSSTVCWVHSLIRTYSACSRKCSVVIPERR